LSPPCPLLFPSTKESTEVKPWTGMRRARHPAEPGCPRCSCRARRGAPFFFTCCSRRGVRGPVAAQDRRPCSARAMTTARVSIFFRTSWSSSSSVLSPQHPRVSTRFSSASSPLAPRILPLKIASWIDLPASLLA
jgi:hypothetical protein